MKIVVCVKQVPVVSLLKFDNDARRVVRDGVPNELNPFDVLGMSLAANIKAERGGECEIVALTMGPPQAREALTQCLAMGADRGVHLNDMAFAGSDTLATARALSLAVKREAADFDLIICGRNSVDAETAQVGAELAELLDLPLISAVRRLEAPIGRAEIIAERVADYGYDLTRCGLPALITVTEDAAPEAYPNRAARQAAQDKPVATLTAADLSDDPALFGAAGSPTWVSEIYSIEPKRDRIVSRDKPMAESAAELVAYLRGRGVLTEDGKVAEGAGAAAAIPRGARRERGGQGAVWVVAETLGGDLRPVTFELLGSAVAVADALGASVEALLLGHGVARHAAALAAYGADRVLVADDPRLAHYDNSLYTQVIADAVRARGPYALLLPSTLNGRELAARAAARLSLGLTGDCIGLEVDDEGRLVQLKPAFGGNIVAPILSRTRPYMATLRPGILAPAAPDWGVAPITEALGLGGLGEPRVDVMERVAGADEGGSDIDSANIIVGVGKGIGGPENLALARRLAEALGGAAIGATRDVTELGWLPRQRQIGLSGKSVAPSLYVAVGVRGVFNHTVGIQRAGAIVAVNNSGRAPIFQAADFGILGDCEEALPEIIKALEARTT